MAADRRRIDAGGQMRWFRPGAELRRCKAVLRTLDLDAARDLDFLRGRVEQLRGRRVRMVPVEAGLLPCGMWVSAASGDFVFYASGTSGLHQRHIVVHEFAHMLLGHVGADLNADSAAALAGRVNPETVVRMLARAEYGSAPEREAELLATMILQAPLRPGGSVEEADHGVRRLSAGMGDAGTAPS
jgi:hypothetical protein